MFNTLQIIKQKLNEPKGTNQFLVNTFFKQYTTRKLEIERENQIWFDKF